MIVIVTNHRYIHKYILNTTNEGGGFKLKLFLCHIYYTLTKYKILIIDRIIIADNDIAIFFIKNAHEVTGNTTLQTIPYKSNKTHSIQILHNVATCSCQKKKKAI